MSTLDADVAILGCGIVGSYLAARLADAGRRVVVVDVARGPGQPPVPAAPAVIARDRPHAGIVDARHHEPGGNSAYWGGAMLRVPEADSGAVFETPALSAAAIAQGYAQVEQTLGFPYPPRREPWADGEGISATQALVLPTSTKHMFAARLAPRIDKVTCRFDTRIDALDCVGGMLRAASLRAPDGGIETLHAKQWVVCMGVVDSNLFARRFCAELFGTPPPALGRHLHDHVSVPLFRVSATRGGDFLRRFPPSFIGGFMGVPRFEFDAGPGPDGWNPRAFLHFVFDFDNVPLYADLKRVLALRQARAGAAAMAGAGLSLLRHGPELLQIGAARFLGKRLHVSTDVPVTAVLDFETFPHVDNRIDFEPGSNGARASMHWDLRQQDFDAFERLVPVASRLVQALAHAHGFDTRPEVDTPRSALDEHLRVSGKDILHLGGGLAPSSDAQRAVVQPALEFPHARNASVISTATLARASVVNPTHTLLAMAEQWRSWRFAT